MKKFMGLVVLILALFTGSYYFDGYISQSEIAKYVEHFNQSVNMQLELNSYQRGFFQSSAQTTLNITIPKREYKDDSGQNIIFPATTYQINFPITIHHGPIIYSEAKWYFGLAFLSGQMSLSPSLTAQYPKLFDLTSKLPVINLSALVEYNQSILIHLDNPAFDMLSTETKTDLQSQGIDIRSDYTPKTGQLKGNLVIKSLSYNKDDFQSTLSNFTIDADLTKNNLGLYFGKLHLGLDAFSLSSGSESLLKISNAGFFTSSEIDDADKFSSQFTFSMDNLSTDSKEFGPMHLNMMLNNLDAKSLADLNNQFSKLQEVKSISKEDIIFTILPIIPKLICRGAELIVSEWSLTTPQGSVTAKLKLSLPEEPIANPFKLVHTLKGNAEFNISSSLVKSILISRLEDKSEEALAKDEASKTSENFKKSVEPLEIQVDTKITNLINAGLLKPKDETYEILIHYQDGKLTVNGTLFNSQMLQF